MEPKFQDTEKILNMRYPEPPWSERDLMIVELLENERLIKEYTLKLAECTHEEDILSSYIVFGYLLKRGAKYYASAIEGWKFRNQILREQLGIAAE